MCLEKGRRLSVQRSVQRVSPVAARPEKASMAGAIAGLREVIVRTSDSSSRRHRRYLLFGDGTAVTISG